MSRRAKKESELEMQQIKAQIATLEKLYLVGITGRTSFILENIRGTKFKLTIGNEIKCSCNQRAAQCSHSLYALLEIFYLPPEHALLFQHTYTDKELRYIIANRRIHLNKVTQFLKHVRGVRQRNVIIEEEDEEDEENLCAICHMQIVRCDATSTCTTVCRNTFHLQCFAQWAKHEMKQNGIVKCPLCRDQKPAEIIREIKQKQYQRKQQINHRKIGKEYNYYCDGCQMREIQPNQPVYKCIHCEDVLLCQYCFKQNKHIKHSFICKQERDKKWRECEDRKAKKKMDSEQGLIRMKLKGNKRLTNFLASSLPCFFSKNTRWNIVECKKLEIKIQELECIACSDRQKAFLRKLGCGHFIHHRCLRRRIEKGRFYCKQDGQKYLQGYEALLKHEQLNKKAVITEKEESQSEEQEREDRRSPQRISSRILRTQKTATSCDSRQKQRKSKQLSQDRNKSLSSKFPNNPE